MGPSCFLGSTRYTRAVIALSAPFFFISGRLEAQGLPVQNASPVPIAIWFIGAFVLGGFIAYGIIRNRSRTRAEKELTDRATRQNYAEEDRKAKADNLS